MNSLIRNLSLFVLICFASCGKDDSNEGANNVDGYRYLSTLNVTDAKSLYKQSSMSALAVASRSGDDAIVTGNTYWKVDADGETKQLLFTGEDGNTANISIESITKLGSRMLYVIPSSSDLLAMGVYDSCHCIIDKQTGKIYSGAVNRDLRRVSPTEDGNGDVFFTAEDKGDGYECYIFKLDISDFTLSKEINLSTNLVLTESCGYEAFGDGYIHIHEFGSDDGGVLGPYVKTPNNSLIEIDYPYASDGITGQSLFTFKGKLYENLIDDQVEPGRYISHKTWLNVINVVDSSLQRETILSYDIDYDDEVYSYLSYNPYKDCLIFEKASVSNGVFQSVSTRELYEFDGTNLSIIDGITYEHIATTDSNWSTWSMLLNEARTSNSWWYMDDESYGLINKISMSDYSKSTVDIRSNYILTEITSSAEGSDITFIGTPLDNITSTIIGTISEDNEVTTTTTHSSDMEVIDLILLN